MWEICLLAVERLIRPHSVQARKLNFNFSNRRSTRVSDIAIREGQDIIEHVQWSYVGVELESE